MKNKIILIIILTLFNNTLLADSIEIKSKSISLDKNKNISILKGDVEIKTRDGKTIKTDYAEYNKTNKFFILKTNVSLIDAKSNIIETDQAEYDEKNQIFKTVGLTKGITSTKYEFKSNNIIFDNKNRIIKSNENTEIVDLNDNLIKLDNFNYNIDKNIFNSIGKITFKDSKKNTYEFSQIYIDTDKKEILGTDIKAYLNQDDLKFNKKNKPRVFSNSALIKQDTKTFRKSIFTTCDYRENDKCPPWSIQSSKLFHDSLKKTIYYDNAVIKVYDIPVFYLPKLAHPDPTVKRRSGFLVPSFSDSNNLGPGISIPYFFDLNKDKNFTLTSRMFVSENPLFLGEYHQVFKNSNFYIDAGFTEGFKKTSSTKKTGEKSHFFSKFTKKFDLNEDASSTLDISVQSVSDDSYLKLFKIDSSLADYNKDSLESSIDYSYESNNLFFGLNSKVYETLKSEYNDKYEYIFPEITLDKNLFSNEKFGSLDLLSNLKIHNYDTNKLSKFLVNDLFWNFRNFNFESGLKGKLFGNIKNLNYETKNIKTYKDEPNSELFGAIGYLSELKLLKKRKNTEHVLKPKMLLRYAPGSMRDETEGSRLNPINAFSLNRLENDNNFETGLNAALGLDYKYNNNNNEFDFSIAQIINEEENKSMPSKTGLDEKLSDLVGSTSYNINDKIKLDYQFALDQNYNDLNYSELGAKLNLGNINFDFNFLQEKKHIGNQEYLKTKISTNNLGKGQLSFETKRNLIKNSSEFYNLSYEYVNDCLRAGLVYRREFYNDPALEPENSLMFKITLLPFDSLTSPAVN
tara:strand:- start:6062 stop:8458 length:2397 start_codon:yes stop_codon:yes gene_type:complete